MLEEGSFTTKVLDNSYEVPHVLEAFIISLFQREHSVSYILARYEEPTYEPPLSSTKFEYDLFKL
jgi:hypothetical protein